MIDNGLLQKESTMDVNNSTSSIFQGVLKTTTISFNTLTDLTTNYKNSSEADNQLQRPINVNGGFIAMAAGLSVIIPLVCVLIIQLRKAKLEERERRRREEAGTSSNSDSEAFNDPPPTYEQLFGPGYEHIERRDASRNETLNQRNSFDSGISIGIQNDGLENIDETNAYRTIISSNYVSSDIDLSIAQNTSRMNDSSSTTSYISGIPNSTVSTISGRDVSDSSINTDSFIESESANSNTNVCLHVNHTNLPNINTLNNQSCVGICPSLSNMTVHEENSSEIDRINNTREIAHENNQLNNSVSRPRSVLQTIAEEEENQTNQAHIDNSNQSNSTNTEIRNEERSFLERRFPGMHVSIHDLFNSIRQTDAPETEPPPSYQEALKILEIAKKAKEEEMRRNAK